MQVVPTGRILGATVEGIDLARPLDGAGIDAIANALGTHGVLRFPGQHLDAVAQRDFSARFGALEINVAGTFQDPTVPQVMTLSNVEIDGRPLGLRDAGQGWHTDMSYSEPVAFAIVLHGITIPRRDERPLGATQFCDMAAAYEDLPTDVKRRLEGRAALHDFEKFWEMMRRRENSTRPPLTEAQRRAKPPVWHPMVLTHPISGRKLLYANPGYVTNVRGLPPSESDELLAFLFAHQTRAAYRYDFEWQEGDVMMGDNLRTIHRAVADYGPDEPRLMKRCQVMATRYVPA